MSKKNSKKKRKQARITTESSSFDSKVENINSYIADAEEENRLEEEQEEQEELEQENMGKNGNEGSADVFDEDEKETEDSTDAEECEKKPKSRKTLKIIIRIILLIIIIGAVIRIAVWYFQISSEKQTMNELRNEVISQDENDEYTIDFETLENINPDFVGWITVGDTNIEYPIAQGEDNDYYLKHNIYKDYSSSGCIFMDYTNSRDFSDRNTVIYGHNMRNDTMFSELKDVYEGKTTDNVITIYTVDETLKYQIFSVRIIDPDNSIPTKMSSETFKDYVVTCIDQSAINFDAKVPEKSNIISLVTCSYTNAERIIVQGYLTD